MPALSRTWAATGGRPYNWLRNSRGLYLDIVKSGEEVEVIVEKDKKIVAVIIPYNKYKKRNERPLGILKGKGTYLSCSEQKIMHPVGIMGYL